MSSLLIIFLHLVVIIDLLPFLIISFRRHMDFIIFIVTYLLSVPLHETTPEQVLQQLSAKEVEGASSLHFRHRPCIILRLFRNMSSVACLKYLFTTRSLKVTIVACTV